MENRREEEGFPAGSGTWLLGGARGCKDFLVCPPPKEGKGEVVEGGNSLLGDQQLQELF